MKYRYIIRMIDHGISNPCYMYVPEVHGNKGVEWVGEGSVNKEEMITTLIAIANGVGRILKPEEIVYYKGYVEGAEV